MTVRRRDLLATLDAATGSRCWRTTEYQGGYASGVAVADGTVGRYR